MFSFSWALAKCINLLPLTQQNPLWEICRQSHFSPVTSPQLKAPTGDSHASGKKPAGEPSQRTNLMADTFIEGPDQSNVAELMVELPEVSC